MTCPVAEPLVVRFADDPASLSAPDRAHLEAHLGQCGACRILIDEQRHVAQVLQGRPPVTVPPGFAASLAARLDAEQGWVGLGNWRRWTVTLAPVAAALVFVAWMGGAARTPVTSLPDDTFDTWTISNTAGEPAALFLQSSSGDALLEAVLTGAAAPAGDRDAR